MTRWTIYNLLINKTYEGKEIKELSNKELHEAIYSCSEEELREGILEYLVGFKYDNAKKSK